jgi:hypothetical protein
MSSATVTALLGVLGALFGLLQNLSGMLQSRVRVVPEPVGALRVVGLQTRSEALPSKVGLRVDRVFSGVFVLISPYFAWTGYELAIGRTTASGPEWLQRSTGVVMVCEGIFFAVAGGWHSWRLRNAAEGVPLHACSAELKLSGSRPEVIRACLHAMAGIGAIREAGSSLSSEWPDTVVLQGGTGAWPERGRGNRVTIELRAAKQGSFQVEVHGESFRAALLDSYKNSRNVRNIIQQLLY